MGVKLTLSHYEVSETQKAINRKDRFKRVGYSQTVPLDKSAPFSFKSLTGDMVHRETAYGLRFTPRYQRAVSR